MPVSHLSLAPAPLLMTLISFMTLAFEFLNYSTRHRQFLTSLWNRFLCLGHELYFRAIPVEGADDRCAPKNHETVPAEVVGFQFESQGGVT